jgi:hypothetical protein
MKVNWDSGRCDNDDNYNSDDSEPPGKIPFLRRKSRAAISTVILRERRVLAAAIRTDSLLRQRSSLSRLGFRI